MCVARVSDFRNVERIFFRFSLYLTRCHFDNLDLIFFASSSFPTNFKGQLPWLLSDSSFIGLLGYFQRAWRRYDEYTDGSRLVKGRYGAGTMPDDVLDLQRGAFRFYYGCGTLSKRVSADCGDGVDGDPRKRRHLGNSLLGSFYIWRHGGAHFL